MGKWYRISLSLAAKCRIGFALAVLLIIGSALLVPYRWMDKLVEQGKLELARAEVEQVLAHHFRMVNDPQLLSENPPLALATEGKRIIKTARWTAVNRDATGDSPENMAYVAVPGTEGTVDTQAGVDEILQEKPLTEWIRLPAGVGIAGPKLSVEEVTEGQPEGEKSEEEGIGGESSVEEVKSREPELPGDAFVRKGIRRFLKDRDRQSDFEFYGSKLTQSAQAGEQQEEEGFLDMMGWMPRQQSGRYLHAVRTNENCLVSGCHGVKSKEAIEGQPELGGPPEFSEGELVGVISVTLPAGQTSTTLLFNRIFIVAAGLMASIIAVVTFYLITQRFILQPVRSLREAADHVAVAEEARDLDEDETASWQEAINATEKIKTRDEFERLARAFNQMLTRLKMAHDRIRESNRALDLQLGELQAKNIALFESNRLKSEFLANVSHELRTPLNAIIGFAELVKEESQQREDEKAVRYTSNILKSGHGLLRIINDLLDLAKIEAGRVDMHWQECSVRNIAEALMNFTRPLAEQKQLQIIMNIDENVDRIETDPGKLQQILFNLLSNAIKFTPPKGRILLDAEGVEEDYVRISVADTGPGISEEDQETIFEKFRQLDASVTREHPGTGLGLAIVKELVDILGGTISVSGAVGQGAIFAVTLPVRRPTEIEDLNPVPVF
jgi:signal transduction histidine kinase